MGAAGQVSLQSEPRVSRIFISYASQDLPIALAIANAFRISLGDVFAEININKWFLRAGDEFNKQIELKLDKTDIFVIVTQGLKSKAIASPDRKSMWSNFVKWDNINTMTEEYRPREIELRKALGQIIPSKDDTERMEPLRQDLADLLNEMEEHVCPIQQRTHSGDGGKGSRA